MSSIPSRAAAWAVHAFTASGAVMGLAALQATAAGDYRAAFLWMIAATAIDGVDGWLARLARVGELAPGVDGARLDDIVDYLTYVVVPAFLLARSELLPPGLAWPAAAAMLLSSAYQFCRTDSKTPDHFFTGFPSYWNIVALYLFVLGLGPAVNVAVLLLLAALVFVPIRYIYPSRTVPWRVPTVALGTIWAGGMAAIAWMLPEVSRAAVVASLTYPLYYVVLSLALHARRRAARP
ncbi:MAG: CDP-alcohol phosphatidyltransferase family protein [Vicinamibacterales bacterium]